MFERHSERSVQPKRTTVLNGRLAENNDCGCEITIMDFVSIDFFIIYVNFK